MDRIITTNIDDSIGQEQPLLGKSVDFFQDATQEAIANTVIGLIGSSYSTSQVYVLFGCVRTGAADGAASGAADVTAGAVFYNGEVYTVDAFSTTNINSQYLSSALSITSASFDPVDFSNSVPFSVHNKRKWLISQTSSAGSTPVSGWSYPFTWYNYSIPQAKYTAIGGGSITSGGGNFMYKLTGNTISWYITSTFTTSGTVTLIKLDMSDVFTRNAGLQFITTGLEKLALSEVFEIQINATGSIFNINRLSGGLSATSYIFYACGTFDI